jgi:hypothetical protein
VTERDRQAVARESSSVRQGIVRGKLSIWTNAPVVLLEGIELSTSPLPRECSTVPSIPERATASHHNGV